MLPNVILIFLFQHVFGRIQCTRLFGLNCLLLIIEVAQAHVMMKSEKYNILRHVKN